MKLVPRLHCCPARCFAASTKVIEKFEEDKFRSDDSNTGRKESQQAHSGLMQLVLGKLKRDPMRRVSENFLHGRCLGLIRLLWMSVEIVLVIARKVRWNGSTLFLRDFVATSGYREKKLSNGIMRRTLRSLHPTRPLHRAVRDRRAVSRWNFRCHDFGNTKLAGSVPPQIRARFPH